MLLNYQITNNKMEQSRVELEAERQQLQDQQAAMGYGQNADKANVLIRLISVLRQLEEMELQALANFDQEIANYDQEIGDYDKYDRAKG